MSKRLLVRYCGAFAWVMGVCIRVATPGPVVGSSAGSSAGGMLIMLEGEDKIAYEMGIPVQIDGYMGAVIIVPDDCDTVVKIDVDALSLLTVVADGPECDDVVVLED